MICFNCGTNTEKLIKVVNDEDAIAYAVAYAEGFCSPECMDIDNYRLNEGNKIISQAEVQLSDVNAVRLQAAGMGNVMAGIKFGSKSGQSEAAPQRHDKQDDNTSEPIEDYRDKGE